MLRLLQPQPALSFVQNDQTLPHVGSGLLQPHISVSKIYRISKGLIRYKHVLAGWMLGVKIDHHPKSALNASKESF